jgi:hypothetical protein
MEGSSQCWFVVLFTLTSIQSAATSWTRPLDLPAPHQLTNVTALAEEACGKLSASPSGGCAYAVCARSREVSEAGGAEAFVNRAIVQNWAANAALGRAVAAHHRLRTTPSDVVLQTRPDVLYEAPIDVAGVREVVGEAMAAGTPPIILFPEGDVAIGGNDPQNVAWLAARSAYDAICPEGRPCARPVRGTDACGPPAAKVLVHAASARGVLPLLARPGAWRVQVRRMSGACSWMGRDVRCFGGALRKHTEEGSAAGETVSIGPGLRCLLGASREGLSACTPNSPLAISTPWGSAFRGLSFNFGGRYYVCTSSLPWPQTAAPSGERRRGGGMRGEGGGTSPAPLPTADALARACALLGECTEATWRQLRGHANASAAEATEMLRGLCAVTSEMGHCATSHLGFWDTAKHSIGDVHECAAMCNRCRQCRYVSFSAKNRDCSWYRACELDALVQGSAGQADDYVTMRVTPTPTASR